MTPATKRRPPAAGVAGRSRRARVVRWVTWPTYATVVLVALNVALPHLNAPAIVTSAGPASQHAHAAPVSRAPRATTSARHVGPAIAQLVDSSPTTSTTVDLFAPSTPSSSNTSCSTLVLPGSASAASTTTVTVPSIQANPVGIPGSIKWGSPLPSHYQPGSNDGHCPSPETVNLLLPINRWNTAAQNLTLGGTSVSPVGAIAAVGNAGLNTVANLFFTVAGFLWSIIYDILQFALTVNLLAGTAGTINTGFALIGGAIIGSGIIVVLIGISILMLAVNYLRDSSRTRVFSSILALVVPIAALQALTVTAAQSGTSATAAMGSPAWFAQQGLNAADALANSFSSAVAQATPTLGTQVSGTQNNDPAGCQAYVEVLYADYQAASKAISTDGQIGSSQDGRVTMSAVSALWEAGYLNNWMLAEFSDPVNAERLYCHYLDGIAVSPHEQSQVNYQAYGATLGTSAAELPSLVIDPTNTDHNQAAVLYGYAACHYNGSGWELYPSWYALGSGDTGWGPSTNTGFTQGTSMNNQCAAWARVGNYYIQAPSNGQLPSSTNVYIDGQNVSIPVNDWPVTNPTSDKIHYDSFTFNTMGTVSNDMSASTNQTMAEAARNVVESYNGSGAGNRLLLGLFTLITAMAYAWALLGLGVGSIVAQLGLIAMMILLPGTIFLLALPRKVNQSTRGLGARLLRLTAGFFASRLVITLILTVLVYLTLTLAGVMGSIHY